VNSNNSSSSNKNNNKNSHSNAMLYNPLLGDDIDDVAQRRFQKKMELVKLSYAFKNNDNFDLIMMKFLRVKEEVAERRRKQQTQQQRRQNDETKPPTSITTEQ
jgi:hypothetical protein